MTFEDYERGVWHTFALHYARQNEALHLCTYGLLGETNKFVLKATCRHKLFSRDDLWEELGDILYYSVASLLVWEKHLKDVFPDCCDFSEIATRAMGRITDNYYPTYELIATVTAYSEKLKKHVFHRHPFESSHCNDSLRDVIMALSIVARTYGTSLDSVAMAQCLRQQGA